MYDLPWGIIVVLPFSYLLFCNKGRRVAKACGMNRRTLLWLIFFVLLGCFFTITAGKLYVNSGGLLLLGLGGRMWWLAKSRERLRILAAALVVAVFVYAFQIGKFWFLVRLSFPTDWLLPLVAMLLALVVGGGLRAAWPALIWGQLAAEALAGYYLYEGLFIELGPFVALNRLFLALAGVAVWDYLRHRKEKPQIRILAKKNSI